MCRIMKVNEIFYSIQGEGRWTGTPCVFIRFSGCNLMCEFCDTDHHLYHEYSIKELVNAITEYPAKHVVFTGGEPTLQVTDDLCKPLKAKGYYLHIETNGTRKVCAKVDRITCSPKLPSVVPTRINEIKVVCTEQDTDASLKQWNAIEADEYYLQPCDTGDRIRNNKILKKCVKWILKNPKWKLSLQTHKLINVR